MREKCMNSTIHYHRIYEKHGAVAPEEILENDIWIDVGNGLREGVFDHHQAGIGWVTVLAVFSAWIDAYDFLGKLSPDMEDGWHSLMNYPPLFLFELLMAIAILLVGIIAVIYVYKAWQDAFSKNEDKGAAERKP